MTLKSIDAKRRAIESVNQHKSRLLIDVRELENVPGCATAAKELGAIIGRLEAWQEKNKPKR